MFVEIKQHEKPLVLNIDKIEAIVPITDDLFRVQCERGSYEVNKNAVKILKQKMGLIGTQQNTQVEQYNQLLASLGTKGPRIQKA